MYSDFTNSAVYELIQKVNLNKKEKIKNYSCIHVCQKKEEDNIKDRSSEMYNQMIKDIIRQYTVYIQS